MKKIFATILSVSMLPIAAMEDPNNSERPLPPISKECRQIIRHQFLIRAIEAQDPKNVRRWIQEGADAVKGIYRFDYEGEPAILAAARIGNNEICQILLDAGANVNQIWNTGEGEKRTPLEIAADAGHQATCELFVKNMLVIPTKEQSNQLATLLNCIRLNSDDKASSLYNPCILSSLRHALLGNIREENKHNICQEIYHILHNNYAIRQHLLATFESTGSKLLKAIDEERIEDVRQFIADGFDLNSTYYFTGNTALTDVLKHGAPNKMVQRCRTLLELGANVAQENNEGQNALDSVESHHSLKDFPFVYCPTRDLLHETHQKQELARIKTALLCLNRLKNNGDQSARFLLKHFQQMLLPNVFSKGSDNLKSRLLDFKSPANTEPEILEQITNIINRFKNWF